MHIAIDIDDTITHAPDFFRLLTRFFEDTVVTIISFREDEEEARRLPHGLGIRFDRLILSNDPEHGCGSDQSLPVWKAELVGALGVDVFFDDMPEIVHLVEPPTKVFMCCDAIMRDWLREQLQQP